MSDNNSEDQNSATETKGRERRYPAWVLGIIGFGGLTLIAIVVLEVILRLAGAGYDTRFFVPVSEGGEKYLRENSKFFWRYMGSRMARTPLPIQIPATKKDGAYRILILGESAALGDPEPAYGFSRYLEVLLENRFPGRDIEIINTATTAINSHVIRDIARDAESLNADLWIAYLGNNEFMGPFGPGSVFSQKKAQTTRGIRFGLALRQFRIPQVLDQVISTMKSAGKGRSGQWGGMAMFSDITIPAGSEERARVNTHFKSNLQSILASADRAGAPVILSPSIPNLKDCGPFSWEQDDEGRERVLSLIAKAQSLPEKDIDGWKEVTIECEELLNTDKQNAALLYIAGLAHYFSGSLSLAEQYLVRACDSDLLPFRMPSSLRQVVLDISKNAGVGVTYLDPVDRVNEVCEESITGAGSFYEHVHLKPAGNYALALAYAEVVEGLAGWNSGSGGDVEWLDYEDCSRRLGLTEFDYLSLALSMNQRMKESPLSRRPFNGVQRKQLLMEAPDPEKFDLESIENTYRAALEMRPDDWLIRQRFAIFLADQEKYDQAMEHIKQCLEQVPHSPVVHYQHGIILTRLAKSEEAADAFRAALKFRPSFAEAVLQMAWIKWNGGDKEAGLKGFDRAMELDPSQEAPQLARLIALKELKQDDAYWEALKSMARQFPTSDSVASELYLYASTEGRRLQIQHLLMELLGKPDEIGQNPGAIPIESELYTIFGMILQSRGEVKDAMNVFYFSGWQGGNVNSLYRMGLLSASGGDLPNAIASFSRVLSEKPEFWSARFNLGVAYAKMRMYQRAVAALEPIPEGNANYQPAQEYLSRLKADITADKSGNATTPGGAGTDK